MKSILDDQMKLIWHNYEKRMKELGFKAMMLTPQAELMKAFTLNYKNLYYQQFHVCSYKKLNRGETSYAQLKLRRLIAVWAKSNVWKIEGGIKYKAKDKYQQFPLFGCQRPNIIPMPKTIKRMQAKCLNQYIEDYNEKCADESFVSRSSVTYIANLRDLRNVLIKHEGLDEETANKLVKLYSSTIAKREVNDFSNEGIDII